MRRMVRTLLVCALCFGVAGCYHATVETGEAPGTRTVEKGWAHGFLLGLVPPSTVETEEECTSGVAKVETKLSFLNQVASFITWGIYTPMNITVTCASSSAMDAGGADPVDSPSEAEAALRSGEAFYVPLR